ncbi:MAG TPA: hypothetical protein VGR01_19750 [Burkholderiales bacterium]|jgi:hypothetical protein|nr:hypothetical protein [Burkholderiales bacterium]
MGRRRGSQNGRPSQSKVRVALRQLELLWNRQPATAPRPSVRRARLVVGQSGFRREEEPPDRKGSGRVGGGTDGGRWHCMVSSKFSTTSIISSITTIELVAA